MNQETLRQHYPHSETAQAPRFFNRAYKNIQRIAREMEQVA